MYLSYIYICQRILYLNISLTDDPMLVRSKFSRKRPDDADVLSQAKLSYGKRQGSKSCRVAVKSPWQ